jgi:hypothetical protein
MPELPQFEAEPQAVSSPKFGISELQSAAREQVSLGYRIRNQFDSMGAALGRSIEVGAQAQAKEADPNGINEATEKSRVTLALANAKSAMTQKFNTIMNSPDHDVAREQLDQFYGSDEFQKPFNDIQGQIHTKGGMSYFASQRDEIYKQFGDQRDKFSTMAAGAAMHQQNSATLNNLAQASYNQPGTGADNIKQFADGIRSIAGSYKGTLAIKDDGSIEKQITDGSQVIAKTEVQGLIHKLTEPERDADGNAVYTGLDPDSPKARQVFQDLMAKRGDFIKGDAINELQREYETGVKAWKAGAKATAEESESKRNGEFDKQMSQLVQAGPNGQANVSPNAISDIVNSGRKLGIGPEKIKQTIDAITAIQDYRGASDPEAFGWLQQRLISGTLTVDTLNQEAARGKLSKADWGILHERMDAVANDPSTKEFYKQFDQFAKANSPVLTKDDLGYSSLPGAKIANYQWERDALNTALDMRNRGIATQDLFNPQSSNYLGKLAPNGADYAKAAQKAQSTNDNKFYNPQFRDPGLTPDKWLSNHLRGQ